jgi:hypothetical protein
MDGELRVSLRMPDHHFFLSIFSPHLFVSLRNGSSWKYPMESYVYVCAEVLVRSNGIEIPYRFIYL